MQMPTEPAQVPVLEDGLVRLRPHTDADLPLVTLACQDAETARWTTVPQPYSADDARGFVHGHLPGQLAAGAEVAWAITRADPADGDRWSGNISVRSVSAAASIVDVGFLTAPWARGQGLMTAALRLASRYALEEVGAGRVEWESHVGNGGSWRVAEKAGFRFEGTLRSRLVSRGERHDGWMASLVLADLPVAPPGDLAASGGSA